MEFVRIGASRHSARVSASADVLEDLAAFFPLAEETEPGVADIAISTNSSDRFHVAIRGQQRQVDGVPRGEMIEMVRRGVTMAVAKEPGIALRAAAAAWMERGVLIVAPPGGGKSSLLAWLIEKNFAYIADDLAILDGDGALTGLAGPLAFQRHQLQPIVALPAFGGAPSARSGDIVLVRPDLTWLPAEGNIPLGLIVFPEFVADTDGRVTPLATADVAGRLAAAMYQPLAVDDPRRAMLEAIAGRVPAFAVRYGSFAAIDGFLAELAQFVLEGGIPPDAVGRFLKGLGSRAD